MVNPAFMDVSRRVCWRSGAGHILFLKAWPRLVSGFRDGTVGLLPTS